MKLSQPAFDYPSTLPLLPLFDHVLLPGGFVRVHIPAAWRKSTALVEHLLQRQGGEVLVAAVPYLTHGTPGRHGGPARGRARGGGDASDDDDACGAGGWTVTLEGRCRLRVGDIRLSLQPQEVYVASVEQLDYFGGAPPVGGRTSGRGKRGALDGAREAGDRGPGAGAGAGAGGDPDEAEAVSGLLAQLLAGTRRLMGLVQGGAGGRETGARVARALAAQGPARAGDVVGALVARDPLDRLAVLSALDVAERLRLVLALQQRLLEVAERSGAAAGGARPGGGMHQAAPGAAPGGKAAPDSDDDEKGREEGDDGREELAALMQKLKEAGPPPEVLRAAQREYRRLRRGSDQHPGHAMALAYLETLANLPWSRTTHAAPPAAAGAAADEPAAGGGGRAEVAVSPPQEPSLAAVRAALDEAHYGLDKIKERIVQYVAVQRLRGWDARAPILCFIGPPGVGKTTLACSVGEVLGRPFQRISLGGVRDEAEIRGHRRTYIGAMPGRVIQALRRAGVRDPVLLLDEVDKMGRDARGDPAAALLEARPGGAPEHERAGVEGHGARLRPSAALEGSTRVLDPEQNHAFVDTYLGLPFDLSGCVFVATANRAADIPPPLLDRMEVVTLGGYTLPEKVHIAGRHLLPRLLREHGLLGPGSEPLLDCPPEVVRLVVERYTREAGVRSLARCLAAVCRHVAVQIVTQQEGEQRQQLLREQGQGQDALGLELEQRGPAGGGRPAPELPLPDAVAAGARNGREANGGPSAAARGSGGAAALAQLTAVRPGHGSREARLWAALSEATGAEPAGAYGGYPWSQLPEQQPPLPQQQTQGGWLSWLRRSPRQSAAAGEARDGQRQREHEQGEGEDWARGWRLPVAARRAAAVHLLPGPGSMGLLNTPPPPLPPGSAASGGSEASSPSAREHAQQALQAAGAEDGAGGHGAEGLQSLRLHARQAGAAVVVVDEALVEAVLGPPRYEGHDQSERATTPGAAAGLVWTAAGGQVQYIECVCVGGAHAPAEGGAGTGGRPATGQLTLTGQLGDVLEESARIALSWVRAHARLLGLPGGPSCPSRCWDVHVHLPAGAVPKDGPSAGVTLAVALVSLFTGRRVRPDVAMTGELTLRGLLLPVGGIKEKLLAAAAAGMARVLVPARNMRDIAADVPADVMEALEVVPCQRVEDALAAAFDPPLQLEAAAEAPAARL
eukprot:scaffold3.g6545.t1